ncbi:hypothetical protein BZA05DRAFT_253800 [Tricharina praecox]|uniref:uncharacterized protein n=1 Tax=Tricharina praecox TaxID=43433 RepID=UPI00221F67F5|nr:uncharacterized protein BZA05DRAFT_253800 [Tricharina praecox]KAI5854931.1 hypothetical protein BZA05DRAFT_253800 [Tricharina praecox]
MDAHLHSSPSQGKNTTYKCYVPPSHAFLPSLLPLFSHASSTGNDCHPFALTPPAHPPLTHVAPKPAPPQRYATQRSAPVLTLPYHTHHPKHPRPPIPSPPQTATTTIPSLPLLFLTLHPQLLRYHNQPTPHPPTTTPHASSSTTMRFTPPPSTSRSPLLLLL